jgi:hypothetical protein
VDGNHFGELGGGAENFKNFSLPYLTPYVSQADIEMQPAKECTLIQYAQKH